MNKKSVLGLLLFSCVVIAGMFIGTKILIGKPTDPKYANMGANEDSEASEQENEENNGQKQSLGADTEEEWLYVEDTDNNSQETDIENSDNTDSSDEDNGQSDSSDTVEENDLDSEEPNPTDSPDNTEDDVDDDTTDSDSSDNLEDSDSTDTDDITDTTDALGDNVVDLPDMQLIYDSNQVDFMKHIPEMVFDSRIEGDLDIINPTLDIKARSAILFDVDTGKVLYYKDPIIPVFPASTAKLLTALVALDWCMEEEEVTVGSELDLVAADSTLAGLKKNQILTIRNLIEGMLVPSGNDAAYVIAAYVGRKSIGDDNASLKDAIPEFIRLMNDKAKSLGTINSCFKTPDGYDAIGQYTTAYDMGKIGMAAADNETILEVCSKSKARNVFADGSDVTWSNTNSLIVKESGRYYPYCLGLKTGTSTMAGRCLISVAKKDGKQVLSVVMCSDSVGRWEDSTKLLKYGLD